MAYIKLTNGSRIHYSNRVLYGQKPINKEKATANLLNLKSILDANQIKYMLIAGTLLGAVREHDFIAHDEDVDLAFKVEAKQKVFDVIPLLIEKGFEIARYDRRNLLSLIRDEEYIDFYFFEKKEDKLRICNGWLVPNRFFEEISTLEFKGVLFTVPYDFKEYLRYEYGENWMIPIKWINYNLPMHKKMIIYIKERSKEILPLWLLKCISNKVESKFEQRYRKKIEEFIAHGGTI